MREEGDFVKVPEPGVFRALDPFDLLSVLTARLDAPLADEAPGDCLCHDAPAALPRHFVAMDLADDEAGQRQENGVLAEILPPGTRRLYWLGPVEHRLERVAERIDRISVFGGLDQMLNGLVSINAAH